MGNDASPSGPIDRNAEYLLGQMLFALGAGAAGVHIRRSAIAAMRDRYQPPTYAMVRKPDWEDDWKKQSIYLLEYFTVIGRFAAELATAEGRTTIEAEQFETARRRVEGNYGGRGAAGRIGIRGDICPDWP